MTTFTVMVTVTLLVLVPFNIFLLMFCMKLGEELDRLTVKLRSLSDKASETSRTFMKHRKDIVDTGADLQELRLQLLSLGRACGFTRKEEHTTPARWVSNGGYKP